MISTISYCQDDILMSIAELYLKNGIDLDPTYSKGVFYKNNASLLPKYRSDLLPYPGINMCSDAASLPLKDNAVKSIMFDPPFIVGHTKKEATGIIGKRFSSFRYICDLWEWYGLCLSEFYRVIKPKGILVVKCQDTVSSGKQHLSHVFIINEAEKLGFICEDIFILLAKHRIKGHNHNKQKHARKFHSYFLVFVKK